MAAATEILTRDVIAASLASPIDWGRFEELVYAILVDDDFPSLTKIGGVNDLGMDALEESFFDGRRRLCTVVQITSAQAQRDKVRDTIKKLKGNGIDVRNLVFVSRHPVTAATRREIIDEAEAQDVTVDVRSDDYLIAQLSKTGSKIFLRFFGSARAQWESLISKDDPLKAASSPLQHALLASLGAFVLSPRARIARHTLFDKTVLAVLASHSGKCGLDKMLADLHELCAGENPDMVQLRASLRRLEEEGMCACDGENASCTDRIVEQFLSVASQADQGFSLLVDYVLGACRGHGLSDAKKGYIARNIRRALLQLLRASGPLKDYPAEGFGLGPVAFSDNISDHLSRDLPGPVAKTALAAMSSFVSDPERAKVLAPLVRSYSALAIRNIDPLGRRWQQVALARNCIALDTDAVLHVLIEELPEHRPLLNALSAIQKDGVQLLLPSHVMQEAVDHVGRAHKTFLRFSNQLLQMPAAMVDSRVWHAVVRGFYYAHRSGLATSASAYLARYWVPEDPAGYIEHLLGKRLPLHVVEMDELRNEDSFTDLYDLEALVLEARERNRLKAGFRDDEAMAVRVRADISMALNLAERSAELAGSAAKGYLVTSDGAFRLIQKASSWRKRPRVAIDSRSVPELASFICGTTLQDDEAVQLLFHPVTIAAAEQMDEELNVLTSLGADLKETALDRLDWDLRNTLQAAIEDFKEALYKDGDEAESATSMAALDVAKAVSAAGYKLSKPVENLVQSFESAVAAASEEREKREEIEAQLRAFVHAARQTTNKGRSRINKIARDLGIHVEEPDADQQEPNKGDVAN